MQKTLNQPSKAAKSINDERTFLTDKEIDKLMAAAKKSGRYGHRDALMITLGYHHAFRSLELVNLKKNQIDLDKGTIYVHRVKNGDSGIHPLSGDEIRELRKLYREYPDSDFVFSTERKAPMTTRTYRNIVQQAGINAGFDFRVHSHLLRHSCGYRLVNQKIGNQKVSIRHIQQYLGHKNIQHTVRYAKLDEDRFDGFEKLF